MNKQRWYCYFLILIMVFSIVSSVYVHHPNVRADADPPTVTINFAGNLSDSGGPYWRPPGESTQLAGAWSDGYYTNDSRQSEGWIYINLTVADTDGVANVWLNWLNETTWTNYTYAFVNEVSNWWTFNTNGNISTRSGYNYSFDVVANDTVPNSVTVEWNKTGIGGVYTRRYVQLNHTLINISYTPFYMHNITLWEEYGGTDVQKDDRLHHDQGTNGVVTDAGYIHSDIPTDVVEIRYCSAFVTYWFGDSICTDSSQIDNVYWHTWFYNSIVFGNMNLQINKTRSDLGVGVWSADYIGVFNQSQNVSVVNCPEIGFDIFLNPKITNLTNSITYGDNDIYEVFLQLSVPGIKIVSNRSFTSFIIPNVPTDIWDGTDNATDTDNDGLSDHMELNTSYGTSTNPFLADTDNDSINDYWENYVGTDPNDYTDWNESTVPAVTTNATTGVEQQNATLHGFLSDDGNDTCRVGFEWGLTTSYGNTDFTLPLVYGQNPPSQYDAEESFQFPKDIWLYNSSIESNSTCENFVEQGGINDTIEVIFRYNITADEWDSWMPDRDPMFNDLKTMTNYTDAPQEVYWIGMDSADALNFTYNNLTAITGDEFEHQIGMLGGLGLYGLMPETTYHYRAFATNNNGTVYGSDMNFTTSDWILNVTTNTTTGVEEQNATLHGYLVNDSGDTCRVGFEWGLTTNYGNIDFNVSLFSGWNPPDEYSPSGYFQFPKDIWLYNSSIESNNSCDNFCLQGGIYDNVEWIFRSPDWVNWNKGMGGGTLHFIDNSTDEPTYGYTFNMVSEDTLSFTYDNLTAITGDEFGHQIGIVGGVGIYGLMPETTYHYRAFATSDTVTVYGDDSVFLTKPLPPIVDPPYDGSFEYDVTTDNLTLYWSRGNNSDQELLVSRNDTYATSPNQAGNWIRQNSTDINWSGIENTTRYYTIWSWNETARIYSSEKLDMTWGVFIANVMDENYPWIPIVNYTLFISNVDRTETYYATGLSNPLELSYANIPYGNDTIIQISHSDYRQRIWYVDLKPSIYHNYTFYLPPIETAGDGDSEETLRPYTDSMSITNPAIDAIINLTYILEDLITVEIFNTTLYGTYGGWYSVPGDKYSFNSTHVVINQSILDDNTAMARASYYYWYAPDDPMETPIYYIRVVETYETSSGIFERAIEDAMVTVQRYINTTDSYENMSSLLTDINGFVNLYLIPSVLYQVVITKSGYDTKISNYLPPPPNEFGQTTEKTFRIEATETEDEEVRDIHMDAVILTPSDNITMWIYYVNLNEDNDYVNFSIYDYIGDTLLATYNVTIYPNNVNIYFNHSAYALSGNILQVVTLAVRLNGTAYITIKYFDTEQVSTGAGLAPIGAIFSIGICLFGMTIAHPKKIFGFVGIVTMIIALAITVAVDQTWYIHLIQALEIILLIIIILTFREEGIHAV